MEQEIHLRSSILLSDEELALLSQDLPVNSEIIADSSPVELYDFSNTSLIDEQGQNSAGWQYSLGIDLSTILILLFSPLPAFFLKTAAEEAGRDFWVGIKKLIKSIKRRRKGVPLKSVQIQISSTLKDGLPFDYVITYLNAQYVDTDTLTRHVQKAMVEMNSLLENTIITRNQKKRAKKGRKIVFHAFISGSNKPIILTSKEE